MALRPMPASAWPTAEPIRPESEPGTEHRLKSLLVLTLALGLSFLGAGGAWAHAVLLETIPEDSAWLEAPPPEVRLRFNEPVVPVAVKVLDQNGKAVTSPADVSATDQTVRIALPAGLARGSYVVSYRATSADGHPVAGSVVFGIGVEPAPELEATAPDMAVVNTLSLANRALRYASLLAAAGGALFLVLVAGRSSELGLRLKSGLCALGALAAATTALGIGLEGAGLAGLPAASLVTAQPWAVGVATTVGLSAAAALTGLLVIVIGLALQTRGGAGAILVGGALAAAVSLALTGHAPTAEPRWLSLPAVALHVLMAAFWVGSLWPLLLTLRTRPPREAAIVVRLFSRLAVGGVALLIAAGAVLSIIQLGRLTAIPATDYGRVWLVKMVLVLVLLGLAALNRQRLTPALDHGGAAAADRLRSSIHAEMALVAGIVLATAGFGLTPPPRTLALQERAHEHGHQHGPGQDDDMALAPAAGYATSSTVGERTALIEVDPARPGRNTITVHLSGPDGVPLTPLEASVELGLPSAGIEPIGRRMTRAGPGVFTLSDADLPVAGRWSLRLDVLVGDFEKAVFQTEVPVRPGNEPDRK